MRRRTRSVIAVVTTIALGGLLVATQREAMAQAARQYPVSSRTAAASTSKGMAAISAATRDGKYLFIFLWRENDVQTRSMYPVFQATTTQWSGSTNAVSVQITDPAEKPMVDKFGVGRAPMPLVLALAPNGAVTKAFPVQFNASQLQQAFVSPATARCMKALQERKLVLLTEVLEHCGWKIKGSGNAAERLGLKPSTLRYRMNKLGIQRPSKRQR